MQYHIEQNTAVAAAMGVDFGNNTCYCWLEITNLRWVMARLPVDIRALLLKSGKEQFLAHGFEKASLRAICKEAMRGSRNI